MQPLRLGDHGTAVAEIRSILAGLGLLPAAGQVEAGDRAWADSGSHFDAALDMAVRAFQQQRGLRVDGLVDETTYRSIKEASYRLGARMLVYQLSAPQYGDDVATLQGRLQELGFYHGLVDGYFGPVTHQGLSSYQREFGLASDGICGPATLRSLEYLGTRVTGGSPHAIREVEAVRRSGPQLTGKRIVIDPALGGEHQGLLLPGADGPISEADVLWDLGNRLEGRMAATGMETLLSRSQHSCPSTTTRAETANQFDADLVISLHCATSTSSAANGVASFHFGNAHGSTSMIGSILSGFIQREIVARVPLQDCRSHGRTWDMLRLTKMPTVQVEIGYLTNTSDVNVLSNPRSRDIMAEAILIAVKRLYLLGKDDQPTGTYTFAELLAEELSTAD
ncbi:N-acetylmuramoyl-L-alanine amidase [Rhodococcus sp. D2-41]|uniref:N-acetylmuramoyl-L-alanine amidase n=1 Tax=Speluncibacter jeojiensis TaxID=2710754 RepID=A0A9X4RH04_9ACTN|nr:N-acetylmuramoyl-L-alanine amidase [Rhodococcus sp. D2-41]MDG3009820.1 N-acetylmuramoyl-L-alanine amidase [Rhodococcus sp. D2-41]MDG3014571.1 N-acetylmuramoyl-L-alanine amidase [Corynebacteriales bacterium D3-21]